MTAFIQSISFPFVSLRTLPRQAYIGLGVFVLLAALGGTLYAAGVPFIHLQTASAADTLGGTAVVTATTVIPTSTPEMREVHIANNGLALIRGGEVLSRFGGTLRIGMNWNGADFTWIVTTDSHTQFFANSGESMPIANIQEGDYVTVTGTLTAGGSQPTIAAQFVREDQ